MARAAGCLTLGGLVLGGPLVATALADWLAPSLLGGAVAFVALPLSLAAGLAAWYAVAAGWLALRAAGRLAQRRPLGELLDQPEQRAATPPQRWLLPLTITLCGAPAGLLIWAFAPEAGLLRCLAAWCGLHLAYAAAAYLCAPLFAADLMSEQGGA